MPKHRHNQPPLGNPDDEGTTFATTTTCLTQGTSDSMTNLDILAPFTRPLTTTTALKRDYRAAIEAAYVPECMALAALLDSPSLGSALTGSHKVIFHADPDGKHADYDFDMKAIDYVIGCELHRFGGNVSFHDNGKGRKDLVSTWSLGGGRGTRHLMFSRICGGVGRGETVRGATHQDTTAGINIVGGEEPTVAEGGSKRDARKEAIAFAVRDLCLLTIKLGRLAYDFDAYEANLNNLFACRDELVPRPSSDSDDTGTSDNGSIASAPQSGTC